MITPHTAVERDPDSISTALGGELAMLHVESGRYYFLNDVAAAVWEQLETPTTPAAICETLIGRYDVTPAQCEQEVLSLLESLLARGVIRLP